MKENAMTEQVTFNSDEFKQLLDQVDPMACPRGELEGLMNEAPDDYFKGFLTGVFQMRQQLAILTLQPF